MTFVLCLIKADISTEKIVANMIKLILIAQAILTCISIIE